MLLRYIWIFFPIESNFILILTNQGFVILLHHSFTYKRAQPNQSSLLNK